MYEYRRLTPEQRVEVVKQRLAQGYPPHSPPHLIREQLFYLLTASCYEHQLHMKCEERRKQVLDLLFERLIACGMELRGWVILPNHYHLLVYVNDFDRIGRILRSIHGSMSRQWNLEDEAVGRKIWYYYSDRAIRSERHYYTTLNYIHYNPVKHGWADSPYDWFCSSVHWYLEHQGREWLRDSWIRYPVRDYGKEWDDFAKVKDGSR